MPNAVRSQITIDERDASNLIITLSDRLDIQTTPELWQQCIDAQAKYKPQQLTINAHAVSYCDGAGIALLNALQQRQEREGKQFQLQELGEQFMKLFEAVQPTEKRKFEIMPEEPHPFAVGVGQFTVDILQDIKNNIIFLGALSYHLLYAFMHLKKVRWQDTLVTIENVGPKAFPIIALIGFLIGLISTFQSARPLGEFGAQIYIINLVGLGLVREMGPLMTAVLLAGRTASAFAAEIGTMKINQEIDALSTMGLNPIRFLTIPRVFATTLMTPFLNIFLILFGLIGCSVVMFSLGFPLQAFLRQLNSAVNLNDFVTGLIKALTFGFVIASVGCLNGLKTESGPSAVGDATTRAVVNSLIMIVLVDGIFAIIYYVLGV